MEKLWQYLMQANAKALFVIALAVLLGVAAWRGWVEFTAETHPAPEEQATGRAEFKPGRELGLIDFATNQLAWAGAPPESPFLPTLEALAADPGAVAAMRERRGRGGREGAAPGGAAKDPFAHLRGGRTLPGGGGAKPGPDPAIPRLTYKGFFKGPDGNAAALFHDSSLDAATFKTPGADLHGATLLEADLRHARIRLAGGGEVDLALNESVDLKPEPAAP